MKKHTTFTAGGGLSLILLLFVIITFLSFASLSLQTATADLNLSGKYAAQVQSFYEARNAAEQCLPALDAKGAVPAEGGFTKTFPAGETLDLRLTVEAVPGAGAEGPYFKVVEERTENRTDYVYDTFLPVMK